MSEMEFKLQEASDLAVSAVRFDQQHCIDAAAYYYREAAKAVKEAIAAYPASEVSVWLNKAEEYTKRADDITSPTYIAEKSGQPLGESSGQRKEDSEVSRCKFLFLHALEADEAGDSESAIKMYTEAIQMCLNSKNNIDDEKIKNKLKSIAQQALERAENLKGISYQEAAVSSRRVEESQDQPGPLRQTPIRPVGSNEKRNQLHRGFSGHLIVTGSGELSIDEKRVLLATSKINQIDYVPFMDIDLKERFQYAIPFTDRDGPLALSPKQKAVFASWARPEEFCREPKMIQGDSTDCYSIKQTIISDCSFVASLAVSALYERRFNKRLITSIIYPQNRNNQPIYNPFGKYMVKLHLNGVPRKVIIDDTLPVDRHNKLLCSFSTNKNELWISLLEKAYMKVMGGYDFPGSNSNIDLHALTGWIPERKAIRSKEEDFNPDLLFETLFKELHKGNLLLTVATGDLPEKDAERAGLVPTHAYAVLDIRRINNERLFKLKNPWSHVRWKGNYSELDKVHWTQKLQDSLNYDPKSAETFDNGVFWIDYNSILNFFDIFYMNWNPELFTFTSCIHQSWSAGVGPSRDNFNIGENPQYRLSVDPNAKSGVVWVLLTRHITSIHDFENNSEYITLLVYKNNGNRVYYPHDPPPYLDGVRINSPHFLTKIILTENSPANFTLVVSQYLKTTTIHYTVRAYATCRFTLDKINDPYKIVKEVKDGGWHGISAGGCRNHPATYINNPKYHITLGEMSKILIELKGPKQYHIGLELIPNPTRADVLPISTAPYRSGFVMLECELPAGTYDIVPSTFLPDQQSPFFLTIKSSSPFNLSKTN